MRRWVMPAMLSDVVDAVVAIVHRDARFLFVLRARHLPGGGYWCPVSGRIESGETHEAAMRREMLEEVGVVATALVKVGETVTPDGRYRLHYWRTRIDDGEPSTASAEIADIRWCTLEELGRLEPTFVEDVRVCEAEANASV